jgi:acid phosphatase (class A)
MSSVSYSSGAKLIVLAVLFSSSFGVADWTEISASDLHVPPPPAVGSLANGKDFETLHRLQESRDASECRFAAMQLEPSFKALYGSDSETLTAREYETAEPLLLRVVALANRMNHHFKEHFHRPRPYHVDPSLHPCVQKPKGKLAYPSGHATIGALTACVLSKIFPKKAGRLERYGDYIGDLRAIIGVHHPSDVVAGQALGKQLCEKLMSETDFRKELSSVNGG